MSRRRGRWSDHYRSEFAPSSPRPVADGIQAESKRGAIGTRWWSKKWISVLESFGWDSRLQRGRTYARKGQVIDIQIEPGQVTAQVQGSKPRPYRVSIQLLVLPDAVWDAAYQAMAGRAAFLAQLLNGDMPQEIEEAFTPQHPLFPCNSHDILADCSCPDWANPCKHIAAVYYLLAEAFDRDPFLIFQLRGRSKEQVLSALAIAQDALAPADEPSVEDVVMAVGSDPLDATGFYTVRDVDQPGLPPVAAPAVDAALLKRLGPLPLSQPVDLTQSLLPLYRTITQWAIRKASDTS